GTSATTDSSYCLRNSGAWSSLIHAFSNGLAKLVSVYEYTDDEKDSSSNSHIAKTSRCAESARRNRSMVALPKYVEHSFLVDMIEIMRSSTRHRCMGVPPRIAFCAFLENRY